MQKSWISQTRNFLVKSQKPNACQLRKLYWFALILVENVTILLLATREYAIVLRIHAMGRRLESPAAIICNATQILHAECNQYGHMVLLANQEEKLIPFAKLILTAK